MSNEDDYMSIEVPDLDDEGNVVPQYDPRSGLSGKFGYAAVGVSIFAIAGQMISPAMGVPASIWAYFPFLWVIAAGIGIWGLFADDKKSLDVFAIVGALLFGIPTIILSIDLLTSLNK